jgi:hypothetical protein
MKLIFFCIVAACAGETVTRPAVASRPHLSVLSSREAPARDLLVAAKPAPEPTMTSADKFSLFLQCFYGFFAVGLLAFPQMYFADTAVVPMGLMTFWEGAAPITTQWFARAMGLQMLAVTLGPTFGVPAGAFFKQMMIGNLGSVALFSWIIFFTEGVGINGYMAAYLPVFAACALGCKAFL